MRIMKQIPRFLCCAILILFSYSVAAQQNIALTTIRTNSGTLADPVFNTIRQAMEETNTPFYWLVAQAASGEERLMVATLYDSYSFMDVNWTGAIGQALAPDELVQFGNAISTSFKSITTARYRARPDLGRTPPPVQGVQPPPDAVVTLEIEVANGRNADFEAWALQVVEATETSAPDMYWNMLAPAFGTNNYLVTAFIPQWEMLDVPAKSVAQRVIEHFGERRGNQMLEDSNEIVLSVKTELYRTRPDLSRPPPQ